MLTLQDIHLSADVRKRLGYTLIPFFNEIFPESIFRYYVGDSMKYEILKGNKRMAVDSNIRVIEVLNSLIITAHSRNITEQEQEYFDTLAYIFPIKICNILCSKILNELELSIPAKNNISKLQNSISIKAVRIEFVLTILLITIDYASYKKNESAGSSYYVSSLINASFEGSSLYENSELAEDAAVFFENILREGACGPMGIRMVLNLASEGNAFGLFEAANLEASGLITGSPRFEKCYEYLLKADQKGHTLATWSLGYMFYWGIYSQNSQSDLFNQDYTTAMSYFFKAADKNCAAAFNSIGKAYYDGHAEVGLAPNLAKAEEYFLKAKAHNYIFSTNNLGKIYEDISAMLGRQIDGTIRTDLLDDKDDMPDPLHPEKCFKYKDFKRIRVEYERKAFQEFMISAKRGDSWASNRVGTYYFYGIGTQENLKESFKFFKIAASAPKPFLCKFALYNLAVKFYRFGVSGVCDRVKSTNEIIDLLREAAFGNDSVIQASRELIDIYSEEFRAINDRHQKRIIQEEFLVHYKRLLNSKEYKDSLKELRRLATSIGIKKL